MNEKFQLFLPGLVCLLLVGCGTKIEVATAVSVAATSITPLTTPVVPTPTMSSVTLTPTLLPQQTATAVPPTTDDSETLSVNPTSTWVDGWLTYQSDFYQFEVSYPPEAMLSMKGVGGYPTEELPENMTFNQYMAQLQRTYPEDICVIIQYQTGFISILAPLEQGGKYADVCPGTGVGADDMVEKAETLIVNNQEYTATGHDFWKRDEVAIWLGELLFFQLEDGTNITLGGGFDDETTFEEYQVIKDVLRQILASFQKQSAADH